VPYTPHRRICLELSGQPVQLPVSAAGGCHIGPRGGPAERQMAWAPWSATSWSWLRPSTELRAGYCSQSRAWKVHAVDDDASREGLDYAGSAKDWRTPSLQMATSPAGRWYALVGGQPGSSRLGGPARMDM